MFDGDAAHALSPSRAEGAGIAIEYAEVLAEALTTSTSICDSLAAYMRMRKPGVDWVRQQWIARDKMRRFPSWGRVSLLKLTGNILYKRSYTPLTEPI